MREGAARARRRVLIVNLTRLGDLLQTSPTIAALRADDPDVEITLLADKNFADVCHGIPGIDRLQRTDLDSLGRGLLAGGRELVGAFESARTLVQELRDEQFDLALNFSSSRMSAIFMSLLRIPEVRGWCATADGHRVIAHRWSRLFATLCLNRWLSDINLVDHYRLIAGGGAGPRRLLYEPSREAHERAAELLAGPDAARPAVALQLGASRENRVWPTESFARLGRRLREEGCRIVLVGGGKERALAEAVGAQIGDGVLDLCGRTDIGTLAAVLGRARLLVTGDTGPMHVAAAMGTPIIGLFFGPALPYDTGPYGEDHVLLHAAVACAPCAHSVNCLDAFCRLEITPDRVAAVARARLAGDWAELKRIAGEPGAVRMFRTGFDPSGLFECRRLDPRGPASDEVLRRAYRAVWLAALEGHALPSERFDPGLGIDPMPFRRMGTLAREGMATALRLEQVAAAGGGYAEIEALGRDLAAVESEIDDAGAIEPIVRPLSQMFRFEQESLEAASVPRLAAEHRRIYGTLAFEADALAGLLSAESATECRHASGNQW